MTHTHLNHRAAAARSCNLLSARHPFQIITAWRFMGLLFDISVLFPPNHFVTPLDTLNLLLAQKRWAHGIDLGVFRLLPFGDIVGEGSALLCGGYVSCSGIS